MINENVLRVLVSEGLVKNGEECVIDLATFDAQAIVAEALEEAGLILEESDPDQMERFQSLMKEREDHKERFGDVPARRKSEQNLVRVLMNGHFLILSPNRGMVYDEKEPESRKERTIARTDSEARERVLADAPRDYMSAQDTESTPRRRRETYNRAAWMDLRRKVRAMGFKPILATGLYQEQGMDAPATEPSMIISPAVTTGDQTKELTLDLARSLNKRYNQDAFIYAGPETNETVWMFKQKRTTGQYVPDFAMGKAGADTMQNIRAKLAKAGEEAGGVYGATQVADPDDDPDRAGFGRKFGKGRTAVDID